MKISFSRHGNEIWMDIEEDEGSQWHIHIGYNYGLADELGLLDKVFIEEEK